jgi:hypothetical protein
MTAWTNKQIKLLRELYPSTPKHEVERALAPHPWASIKEVARDHQIRRHYRRRNWKTICQSYVMQTGLFKVERTA